MNAYELLEKYNFTLPKWVQWAFVHICISTGQSWTRGSWALSLTWGTVPINKHFCANSWLFHNKWELKFPSNKDTLRQVLLKLTLWFWRWFLNFVIVLMLFCHKIPLEKDKPFKYHSSKNALCQVWFKLALAFEE